ncbi:hypothetical protein Bca52824_069699 [Brassica carinata]|uniref:Helicase MAGATAMA 3 n=1 Tax=Brassica carinata TaxID=52824 RepID=A0A8X7U1A9_BRACI|nr:hypothetical protein Bca52824_069699 [Brassica carinata]
MAIDRGKLQEEETSAVARFHKIILGWDYKQLTKENEVKGSSFPSSYGFAVVENRQSNLLRLPMYLAEEVVQITKNTRYSRTNPFIQSLSNMRSLITSSASLLDKRVFTLKLCSLSTIIGQYIALRSISSLPFKDLIFTAAEKSCGSGDDDAWKISRPLHEFFTENLNKSQKEAIDVGLSRRSFVLIQGPPGTGKTQTILSILGAILHATPARVQSKEHELKRRRVEMTIEEKYVGNHWAQASPWVLSVNPRDAIMPEDGDDGLFPTSGNDMVRGRRFYSEDTFVITVPYSVLFCVQKPEVINANRKYRTRVLVYAPSNSALDEILLRLLITGLRDENAQTYTPKIVRIGLKAHHSVMSVSLDHLVAQNRGSAIDKPKQGTTGTDVDSIRTSILDEAAIVFATLSFSGSPLLAKSNRGFDVVIMDEAAQAVEPATLIPLATRCKQVFLVGDPKQLPATVISTVAQDSGYGTSMFERLQKAGYPVNMLKTQHQMHPEASSFSLGIRSFPSKEFYEEALEDGSDIEAQTTRDWHRYRCLSQHPGGATGSRVNLDEVEFVLLMYHRLVTMYPELKSSSPLAIISPYNYQVKTFRDRFKEMFGAEAEKVIDINTVDGLQGREKDVAIFSCVRANDKGEIGFLSNSHRMNVGITRAKSSVLVVGSAATLKSDPLWKNLVESAEKRNRLFKVSKPMNDFFSEENLERMKVTEKDMEIPDALGFEDEAPPLAANYVGNDDNDFGDGGDGALAEED